MTETETAKQPQTAEHSQLLARLEGLEAALVANDPQIRGHMAEIHRLLTTYEELVHLLSDEEIGKIMAAQQKLTNTSLVAAIASKKTSTATSKKAAGIGLGDL